MAHRGLSTDQQISIEGLILQRKMQRQQEMDSTMVALIAQESAIGGQMEAAERRANLRCSKYTATNVHWQMVDNLVSKQVQINNRMDELTKTVATDGEMNEENSIVTQFLNRNNPHKKAKCDDNDVHVSDDVK